MSENLTPKQARFVEEFLIDLNATQAAIRAGYSEKTASEQGARLLVNVKVAEAIRERKEKREERTNITQVWVVNEMAEQYRLANQRVPKLSFDGEQLIDENGNPVFVPIDQNTCVKILDCLAKHTGTYEKDNKREFTGGLNIIWGDKDGSSD